MTVLPHYFVVAPFQPNRTMFRFERVTGVAEPREIQYAIRRFLADDAADKKEMRENACRCQRFGIARRPGGTRRAGG